MSYHVVKFSPMRKGSSETSMLTQKVSFSYHSPARHSSDPHFIHHVSFINKNVVLGQRIADPAKSCFFLGKILVIVQANER